MPGFVLILIPYAFPFIHLRHWHGIQFCQENAAVIFPSIWPEVHQPVEFIMVRAPMLMNGLIRARLKLVYILCITCSPIHADILIQSRTQLPLWIVHANAGYCRNFDDNNLHDWQPNPNAPMVDVQISNVGSQNGAGDYYVLASDLTGMSQLMAEPGYNGRWCCGEFCYDYKVIDDGDPQNVLNLHPVFLHLQKWKRIQIHFFCYSNRNRWLAPHLRSDNKLQSGSCFFIRIVGTVGRNCRKRLGSCDQYDRQSCFWNWLQWWWWNRRIRQCMFQSYLFVCYTRIYRL